MTAVKTLVAVMTLLLVLGLGLLAYGMMQQSSQLGRSEGNETGPAPMPMPTTAAPAHPLAAPVQPFNILALDEPDGSAIVATTPDAFGHLLLTISGGGIPDRVVVIDLTKGQPLGTITLGGYTAYGRSSSQ